MLNFNDIPSWFINLDQDDVLFIKKFILTSGSLKDMASAYNISYPTMRLRLNRLIEKISLYEESELDPYVEKIKILALENKIDLETAKNLINDYKKANVKNAATAQNK